MMNLTPSLGDLALLERERRRRIRERAHPSPTSAERAREQRQCLASSAYFVQNHCKLVSDRGEGIIPFHPFDYQYDLLETFRQHLQVIILKARQLGITELVAAYAVWKAQRPYQTIVAISQGE